MSSPHLFLPHELKKKTQSGTLAAPSLDDSILCCSKVLHRHILQKDVTNATTNEAFDIDNFVRRRYNVMLPVLPKTSCMTIFRQRLRKNQVPTPDQDRIHGFVKKICYRAKLNPEIVIIALIYIERLMETNALNLSARNWIPVVSIALLTASKVWDDHSTWNADFAEILPLFTIKEINELERHFLTTLNYTLYISPSDYARYYFGLRALKQRAARTIPKYYLQLNIGGATRVATKTIQSQAKEDFGGIPMSL